MRRVQAQRLPLALWDYGGQGPVVLFLHGFLDGGRSFEDVALSARDFCRPLCLDWRGHGASGRCSKDAAYHQLDHLKDLVAVMDELEEGGDAVEMVVAHSMGGTIALMLAAFAPSMVKRLLLLDCVGGYAADAKTQLEQLQKLVTHFRQPVRPFRTFESRQAAEERVRQNNPGLSVKGAERIVRHYLQETKDGRWEVLLDPRLRGPNPYRLPENHWLEICSAVTCPTLVLAPEGGYMFRIPTLQQRLEKIPHCERQDVSGVGHHVHVEAPEVVVGAMRKLLERPA